MVTIAWFGKEIKVHIGFHKFLSTKLMENYVFVGNQISPFCQTNESHGRKSWNFLPQEQ